MRLKIPMNSDKKLKKEQDKVLRKKLKKAKKLERKTEKRNYLSNWHPKFMCYVYSHDMDTDMGIHVFFETIERKIKFIKYDNPCGTPSKWEIKMYRMPEK